MSEWHLTDRMTAHAGRRALLRAAGIFTIIVAAALPARADDAKPAPEARIIVIGEGSVSAAPDYARITSGVTTRAKTAKEASDANANDGGGHDRAASGWRRAAGHSDVALLGPAGLHVAGTKFGAKADRL